MAYVGLKHPVFAPIETEAAGSLPTYSTGLIVGKAIGANVSITLADTKLYADDEVAESDKGFQSGTISANVDDLTKEAILAWFGSKEATVGGAEAVQDAGTYNAPFGGFGYYRVRQKKGVRSIRAFFYYKTQFGLPSEDAATKGDTVEYQTPTTEGEIFKTDTPAEFWRVWADFAAEADAVAWLNELANIGEPASLTNLNAAITTAVAMDAETYTSASWVDVAVSLGNAQAVAVMDSPSQARVDEAESLLEAAIALLVERA